MQELKNLELFLIQTSKSIKERSDERLQISEKQKDLEKDLQKLEVEKKHAEKGLEIINERILKLDHEILEFQREGDELFQRINRGELEKKKLAS